MTKSTGPEIRRILKDDITSGTIEPGVLLSESELADRFGVSRTPVREALHKLAADGLVTSLSQRGHLVNAVSLSQAMDAFRVREILEVEAVSQAVDHMTDMDIAHLRETIESCENGDLLSINRDFHLAIARGSGNQVLADLIDRLLLLMQRIMNLNPRLHVRKEEDVQQTLEIVEALERRDKHAAVEAMTKHIEDGRNLVMRQE